MDVVKLGEAIIQGPFVLRTKALCASPNKSRPFVTIQNVITPHSQTSSSQQPQLKVDRFLHLENPMQT